MIIAGSLTASGLSNALTRPLGVFVLVMFEFFLISLVLIGYETLFLGTLGTTPGKAALGLRVEARSGEKIEFARALQRSLGVWFNGCGAYLFFPIFPILRWRTWYLRLPPTGSTAWDAACSTRVAGGPVPLWRTWFAGMIAITAFTLVLGLQVEARKETSKELHESIAREYGLSGTPATAPAPSNAIDDPAVGKTPVEPRQSGPDPSAATTQNEFGYNRKAAEQGNAAAQNNLGFMYELGNGVPQDYTEAVKWYRKAAEQGLAGAQSNLGSMYYHGKGVAQDDSEALKWYWKAANQGIPQAQHTLGFMYLNGQGVQQDYIEAYKWFDVAGSRYSVSEAMQRDDAVKNRDLAARKMISAQIDKAQKLAREWKPNAGTRAATPAPSAIDDPNVGKTPVRTLGKPIASPTGAATKFDEASAGPRRSERPAGPSVIEPTSLVALNDQMNHAWEAQNYQEAERLARIFIQRELRSSLPWNMLGLLALQRGQLDEADAALRRAVELNPTDTSALTNLAISYSQRGRNEQAVVLLTKAHDLNPNDESIRNRLASIMTSVTLARRTTADDQREAGWEAYKRSHGLPDCANTTASITTFATCRNEQSQLREQLGFGRKEAQR